jgi:tetraacyldisaccharide 4'-kinase
MRSPAFWWQGAPSRAATLLYPASLIYGLIGGRRMSRPGERASVPVICIGNFTIGGAGKTPTALKIAAMLRDAGESPAFLSRGYGGQLAGPVRVEDRHDAADVGDEPLLLARTAPTIVSRHRPAGARLAIQLGAGIIVMDDGLQNPSLAKDFAIAVVDGTIGLGNGLPLPAGPLRAPMAAQWPAVDAVLVIGDGEPGERTAQEARTRGKIVFRGRLVPETAAAAGLQGQRVLAFAGIGRPEKFFDTLRSCGAVVEMAKAFPDHHPFSPRDLAGLRGEAKRRGLQLVTTQKDMARMAGAAGLGAAGDGIAVLPVQLQFEDEEALRRLVQSRLGCRA